MTRSQSLVFVFFFTCFSAFCNINYQDHQVTINAPEHRNGDAPIVDGPHNYSAENEYSTVSFTTSPRSDNVPYIIDSLIYNQSGIRFKEIITHDNATKNFSILKLKYLAGWVNNTLSTFTYDENGNLLEELSQDWDVTASAWKNYIRKTSSYDEQNNRLTYLYENWDADENLWVASRRYTYTYDDQHNQLSQEREDWVAASSSWSTYQLVAFTYDDKGNNLSAEWDYISNIWKDDWRYSFTYDSAGNRLSYKQDIREPNTTEWLNNTRYLYTYDSIGNLLIALTERWNIYIDEWYNGERTIYTYDSIGNLIERIYETAILNTDLWQAASYRFYFSYNENNELIYELTEKWDIIDSSWYEYKKVYYDYDNDGNVTYFAAELWDKGIWQPTNSTISFYFNEQSISYQLEELNVYYSTIEAGSAENDLLSFVFETLDPAVSATITGTEVNLVVPFGTDISALIPTIEISDLASINPASGLAQDFSSPMVYTVTAENGDEKTYSVNVEVSEESTGIAGKEMDNEFSIYPNPANKHIYFNKEQTVVMYNAQGAPVKTEENVCGMNTSDLNAGVYFIMNERGEIRTLVIGN